MADVSQIVLKDANGNTIGTYNVKDTSVPHDSKSASSGGTTLSLVTTGEKYSWNNKMNKINPTGSGSFHFSTADSSNIGDYAIAMGFKSEARGTCSTAIGTGTIAKNAYQHVIGRYNIEDPGSSEPGNVGTYAEIVGNGSSSDSSHRSNARTLDWHGNEVLAGGLKINGTQDVATKVDILPNYWSLFSDLNTSNTIKTLNVVSGRKISDFSILFAIVIRGNYERASAIIPVGRFTDGMWVSLTEVDSAKTQRWYEVKYVDDTHVTVQCSSNATGSEVHIYGLGANSTY